MGEPAAVDAVQPAPDHWLGKKLLDENSLAYRTVWDLYLKFYTVFLTFSILALGLTVQHVAADRRWPIVVAFVVQNLLSAGSAAAVARFSRQSAERYARLCEVYLRSDPQHAILAGHVSPPVPGWLGFYSAGANLLAHASMIGCWLAILWV